MSRKHHAQLFPPFLNSRTVEPYLVAKTALSATKIAQQSRVLQFDFFREICNWKCILWNEKKKKTEIHHHTLLAISTAHELFFFHTPKWQICHFGLQIHKCDIRTFFKPSFSVAVNECCQKSAQHHSHFFAFFFVFFWCQNMPNGKLLCIIQIFSWPTMATPKNLLILFALLYVISWGEMKWKKKDVAEISNHKGKKYN